MELTDNFQHSEESLEHMIDVAARFEENHYMEAVRQKRLSEYDILQLTEDVRLWHSRMRKESLRLALFSEHFLDDFATDDNRRFHDAFDLFNRVRSTLSGTRKVFRRFCRRTRRQPTNPEASTSVYDRCTLSAHAVSRDIFGVSSYDENVQTLYREMSSFFTTLVMTLSLCHRMIRDEAVIRGDGERCLDIYRKCRNEIIESARLFAKTFGVKVETISESELIERRRKAKSMKDYAQRGYHRHNKSEFMTVVAYEVISEGHSNGLSATESLLFGNDVERAMRVRKAISRMDELAGDSKNISGRLLLEFIKWSGVSPQHERKLYHYFCDTYKGSRHIVGWTAVFDTRKRLADHFTDQQLADFFNQQLASLTEQAA